MNCCLIPDLRATYVIINFHLLVVLIVNYAALNFIYFCWCCVDHPTAQFYMTHTDPAAPPVEGGASECLQ